MNTHNVDIVVIGAGPGGYVAAVRCSQLGLKTICVENKHLGGICLNWGCVPTKALLRSAEYMNFLKRSSEFGFAIENYDINFEKVVERSRGVANRMSQGIAFLFKKYNVTNVTGTGCIASPNTVEVRDESGNVTDMIEAKNIIIATGSRPRMFPSIEVDRKRIITSKEAMIQPRIPKSLIVMGAGAIGIEFAHFYNSFGTQVTIIEMKDRILPIEDPDISKELERNYRKAKIKILTSTRVISAKTVGEEVQIEIEKKDGTKETLTSELALNAIGIQANIENIGLEKIGVEVERGFIKVDKHLRTNIPTVYAIGDIAGAPWLAHKASAEGIAVAEFIAGESERVVDYENIPGCTYCQPQVASVGLSEAKAKEMGLEVRIGKFPFTACAKSHALGEPVGFIKLVFDKSNDELLGAHLIGPEVTELLSELCLAKHNHLKAAQIIETIHPHPTLSEAVMEAAAQCYDQAVNC